MKITATLPPKGRNLRLDLFRGLATWAIFLDSIPDNALNWITTRNYGFSDATDLFVFVVGYSASFVYARRMAERGFIFGATRLFKRAWQLYVAHVILFVIYVVAVNYVALRYNVSDIIDEFNVGGLADHPTATLGQGLLLGFKPRNLDVLPLYIMLMLFFPPVLWMLLRKPDLTILVSLALYFCARQFGWNLPAFPAGSWHFNPFCWQLLFVFGAWFALGGAKESRPVINSPIVLYCGVGYLLFSLVMTMAGRLSHFGAMFPRWLFDAFNPNDKTNLAPYRVLHFIVIAFFVTRFVPQGWPGLEWRIFDPIVKCGQSIAVFCIGMFLSFAGRFGLTMSSGSLLAQILVSVTGIATMTAAAYYISWSNKQDELLLKRPPTPIPSPSMRTQETGNRPADCRRGDEGPHGPV
ncbi:MAG: OpgC domain-containing protein [Bradyrhizobium sp.]